MSDWLPDLLAQLWPQSVRLVRDHATTRDLVAEHRSGRLYHHLLDAAPVPIADEWRTAGAWSNAHAEAAAYLGAISELAANYHADDHEGTDPPEHPLGADALDAYSDYRQGRYPALVRVVETVGTGNGPVTAGRDALEQGPVWLHGTLDDHARVVRVRFDAPAWRDASPDTARRALDTLAMLAEGFRVELVVTSPGLARAIRDVAPEWAAVHLTPPGTPPPADQPPTTTAVARAAAPGPAPGSESGDERADEADVAALRAAAVDVVEAFPDGGGHYRILDGLPEDGARTVRSLRNDPEIDLAPGSVDRYVGDLEAHDLIHVDRSPRHNRLRVTRLGAFVQDLIGPQYRVLDPRQRALDAYLTATPHASAGTVYCAHEAPAPHAPPEEPVGAEAWLAGTGDPDGGASFVQWLDGPDEVLDAWGMHERITGALRGPGVTLVDDPIDRFEDGRVAYISAFDDEFLVTTQYGGPLATLGRLAGALLSNRALSTVLTEDRLGSYFQQLHDGAIQDLDERIEDVVRWGHQVGWFSRDEEDYAGWRDRVGGVRAFLLEKVGELAGSEDFEARGELFRDLHGLIATATQLYHAAGIDVTINLRVPDTLGLEDEVRKRDFLDFLAATVPKQTAYEHHSGYRLLLEDRPGKLKRRLPYEVDPDDGRMVTTADWLLSGPSMTQFADDITRGLQREAAEVREQVRDGTEAAPVMEIPVQVGNTYVAIRDIVARYARRKHYQVYDDPADGSEHEPDRGDVDRLARVVVSALNTADAPHRANPHDAVEAMLRLARTDRAGDVLHVADLEAGLARLPADRLLPEFRVTTTRIVQVLLAADGPLGRSEIVERAGISPSTYDRRYAEAAAIDVVEPVREAGRRRWTATLLPWWSPDATTERARGAGGAGREAVPRPFAERDDGDLAPPRGSPGTVGVDEVLSMVALRAGKLTGDDDLLASWHETPLPGDPLGAYASPSAVDRYRALLWAQFATVEELQHGPGGSARSSGSTSGAWGARVVRIGRDPAGVDSGQQRLDDKPCAVPGAGAAVVPVESSGRVEIDSRRAEGSQ